jgi:hypothetical protein
MQLVQRRHLEFFYDDHDYYAYVLLSSTQGELTQVEVQEVIAVLNQNGFRNMLSGRSYRPASNGRQYQYYIRIADEYGRKPNPDKINSLLKSITGGHETRTPQNQELVQQLHDRLILARQEYRKLLEQLREAQAHRAASDQKIASLTHEVSELKLYIQRRAAIAREEKARLLTQIGDLQAELENVLQKGEEHQQQIEELNAARQRNAEERAKAEAERINAEQDFAIFEQVLTEEKAELERLMKEQEDEYVKIRNDYYIVAAENEQLKTDLIALEERNRILSSQVNTATTSRSLASDFASFLECLLPCLEICEESIYFLLEVKSYTKVLHQLQLLNSNPLAVSSKRVQNAKDWLEISHVSIGDSDNGRIYFTKSQRTGKYVVLVSHKDTQEADIKKLKRMRV